jgi:hypothetical protein
MDTRIQKALEGTDPSVPLEDTQVKLNSAVFAYVRALDLWRRSGKFDVIIPYSSADASANLAGEARTRKVSGFQRSEATILHVVLRRAPAVSLEDFRDYRMSLLEEVSRSRPRSANMTPTICST